MELKPGYKQSEVGVIPENWEVMLFAELFEFRNGVNADKASYGQGVRFINVLEPITYSHIYGSEITGQVTLPEPVAASYAVRRGDILFNRTSETQDEVGLAATYLGTERVVFGGFVIRGRPIDQSLDPIYSGYALRAPIIRSQIIPMGQGAIRANIGQHNLGLVVVPVPSLTEQRAIAGALSDVDALIGALEQLIAKKRDLKEATMQQLLTGQKRLPGFSGEWEMKRLRDVTEVDPDNLGINTAPDYEFNYISLEDVDAGVLRNSSEHIFCSAPSRARRRLQKGDILVSTVRPNLKSHLLFTIDAPHWVCSTGFAVVRCREGLIHPGYVFSHLFGDGVSQQIDALLTGSNYPAINGSDVRDLRIPFPRYTEQTAIAEVLSDMDAEIATLEQRRDKTRDLKQGMMQELLTGRTRLV